LLPSETTVGLGIASSTINIGSQAVDLPFNNWTLVSWTGTFGLPEGEAILLDGAAVADRFAVSGFYEGVGLDAGTTEKRFVYTSLTPLGEPNATTAAGLYCADVCAGPALCGAEAIATWGEYNGPVTADLHDNVFAIQTSVVNGNQTLRAFAASTVAPGSGPTAGNALFTLGGFGSELAAMAIGTDAGLVFFQPYDGTSYAPLDVVAQRYTVSGTSVTADGVPVPAVVLTAAGTETTLMTDDTGRLWIGVVTAAGTSTFFVLGEAGP
jgi:hypothetical protein